MSYYLVRITDPEGTEERPEQTTDWIARALAVGFHAEVAVRPWQVDLSIVEIIDDPKAWHRFNSKGNPVVPEEEVAEGSVVATDEHIAKTLAVPVEERWEMREQSEDNRWGFTEDV